MDTDNTGDPGDTAEIRKVEERRWAGLRTGQWEDVIHQLHPELRYTHASGVTDTRDEYAGRLRAGFYDYSAVTASSDHVLLAGDTGIVWGTMGGTLGLGTEVKQLDSTTVTMWLRGKSGWHLVASQSTPRRRQA